MNSMPCGRHCCLADWKPFSIMPTGSIPISGCLNSAIAIPIMATGESRNPLEKYQEEFILSLFMTGKRSEPNWATREESGKFLFAQGLS